MCDKNVIIIDVGDDREEDLDIKKEIIRYVETLKIASFYELREHFKKVLSRNALREILDELVNDRILVTFSNGRYYMINRFTNNEERL